MWRPLTCVLVLVIVPGAETVSPPSCTFDNGWCQWRPLNNSQDFTWHMGSGPTIDRLSGPDGDHTTTHGKYIYIKGRDAQRNSRNASAVVESNVTVNSDMQISFWYNMNGIGIGSLTLAMSEGNGSETTLWKKKGRQGPSWIQATVDLPPGTYVISFKATIRLFYGSDLAIDDVEIGPVPTTTNPPPTTLPPSSELPFFCNFDSSAELCGLQLIPSLGDTVGWNMTSKNFSHDGYTYIHGDASGGKGKYLLLSNWNLGENGDAARIVSPFFSNDGAACLSLKLYLARISSGTLSVYQKLLPTMELKLLHEEAYKDDVKSGHWSSLLVTLKNSTLFQVVLEGSYTGFLGSVIGVDDIKIEHGPCVHTTTSVSTKPPTSTASLTSSETSSRSTKLTTKSVTSTQVGISSNLTAKTSLVSSNLHTLSTSLNKISTTMSSSLLSPETTLSIMTSTPSSVSSTTSSMTTPTLSSTSTFSISSISRPTTTITSPALASVSSTVSSTNSPALSSTSVSSSVSSTNSSGLSSTSVSSTVSSTNSSALSSTSVSSTVSSSSVSSTNSPALSSTSVSSTVSSTNSPALSSTSVSSTVSSTHSPALSSTSVSSTVSSTNSPALSSTSVSSTVSSTTSPALSLTSVSSSVSSTNSPALSSTSVSSSVSSTNSSGLSPIPVSSTVSSTNSSALSSTSVLSSVSLSIKHTPTMLTTEADIQTTTLKSEFTSLLNATKTSESSLSSASSSTILLSTIMSVLQSTPSQKPTMKSSTPTSPTPEITSSTDFPTEASNTSGRETTAIVLGVCLPIIALVIISVIVLICKKDNSMNLKKTSIQCQKKTRQKEEKYSNVTIEMSSKQNGIEHVQVAVTGFHKLET